MSNETNNPIPLGEIVQGPSAFEQFLERNQKLMAVSAIALALGIGGFMVYKTIAEDHAAAAGAAYSAAKDVADFEQVRKDFADTPSAATAALSLAEKQWADKKEDEAIATLRELIAKSPSHPAAVIAQMTLGNHLLAQGKMGDAESAFQAIVDQPKAAYLAPAALIAMGDMAKKAGDLPKAEDLYKKVSKDYGENALAQTAQERVRFLNFKEPVEIEAPPVVQEPPASILSPTDGALPTNVDTGNPLLDQLSSPTPEETPEESIQDEKPPAAPAEKTEPAKNQ